MSRYRPNRDGFGAFMVSQQMQKPVTEIAEAIAVDAAADAPKKTGALAAGFEARPTAPTVVNGAARVSAEVRNEDPAAAPNEFGGKRNKANRTLGRAAAKYGDVRGSEGA